MSSEVIMECGPPGSGKTSLAKRLAQERGFIRLTADDIRRELSGSEKNIPKDNPRVWEELHSRLDHLLACGEKVIVDVTNAKRGWRKNIIDIAKRRNARVTTIYFLTPLEECLRRNRGRDRLVEERGLRQYWEWCHKHPPRHNE